MVPASGRMRRNRTGQTISPHSECIKNGRWASKKRKRRRVESAGRQGNLERVNQNPASASQLPTDWSSSVSRKPTAWMGTETEVYADKNSFILTLSSDVSFFVSPFSDFSNRPSTIVVSVQTLLLRSRPSCFSAPPEMAFPCYFPELNSNMTSLLIMFLNQTNMISFKCQTTSTSPTTEHT